MNAFLTKTFQLQPQESYLVLILGCLLLSNSLARQVSDVVAVSGFLSTVGVNQILLVWLVDMVLTIAVTAAQSLIVDRFNRIRLIGWMSLTYALLLVAVRILFALKVPGGINYTFLYLLAEQQLLFFPIVFWILANDVMNLAQAKRLFPLIATGNFAGQFLGLGIAAASPLLLDHFNLGTEELLLFNAVVYLIAYGLVRIGLHDIKVRHTSSKKANAIETLTEAWGFIREVDSFRFMMLSIIGINVCLTVFEFHFLVVTEATFNTIEGYQQFYSLFRLGIISLSLLTQGFLTSRLINIMQLKNSFFLLPISQLIASVAMILFPGIGGGVGGFSLSKLTQTTVDESARKSLQALVPEERRGRVSLFMDSYLFAVGTVIGCLLTGLVVLVGLRVNYSAYFYAYLAIAVLSAIVTILFVFKMRTVYDSSLFNWRLKRRQRAGNTLDKLNF